MEMQLIRTFLSLAEVKRLSLCADLLCLTKSAVSSRIRQLENQLGKPLFSGSNSGMVLTKYGQSFYPHAAALQQRWEQARQEMQHNSEEIQTLRLGSHPALAHDILLRWTSYMWQADRSLNIHMAAHYSQEMINEVAIGNVDIGLIFITDATSGLTIKPVMEDRLLMVSTTAGLNIGQVDANDYLYLDWGWGYSAAHSERLPQLQQRKLSSGHGELGLDWLLLNGGTAYLPERTVHQELDNSTLFQVADAPQFKRPIYAVYPRQSNRKALIDQSLTALGNLHA
ncbi:LysR family transcriptional regulator [Amphritea opalescens]|uniref:LysR family transcriptional regulator n=1 Tax=Amphritea opalescens TaxID=2490544 RepID=A0A430KTS1_9GAMM|nr:LysR family transcriptional regulator [Amphritea opalescens]RTE66704.1 LysR family transcriptional regulator [Amphritea opalescens]